MDDAAMDADTDPGPARNVFQQVPLRHGKAQVTLSCGHSYTIHAKRVWAFGEAAVEYPFRLHCPHCAGD